jgi:hypothetical protein
MSSVTRREAMKRVAAAGAVGLGAGAAAGDEAPGKKPKANHEEPVHSKALPDTHGPRELFAVVDMNGRLQRGLHAVAARQLDVGTYEVIFSRDVRKGAYSATVGGHGYDGLPRAGVISVMGRASDPKGVLVFTSDVTGAPSNMGFHLLVLCPDGYAG